MSYNIVKKGDSVCLVKKQRRKPYETYIGSLGVMEDPEFNRVREYINSLPQEKRITACQKIGFRETRGIDTTESVRIINLPKAQPKKVTDKLWKPKQHRAEKHIVVPGSIARKERPAIRGETESIAWEFRDHKAYSEPIIYEASTTSKEKHKIVDKRLRWIEQEIFRHQLYKQQRIAAHSKLPTVSKTSDKQLQRDVAEHDSYITEGKAALKMAQAQKRRIPK